MVSARARTVGAHPRFIAMIRELIQERIAQNSLADSCRENCCPAPRR